MAFTWTNIAETGKKYKIALLNEIQNAIKQLAADLYATPSNGGAGTGILGTPIQKSWRAGASTTNGETGRAISFTTAEPDTNFSISIAFKENPGPDIGAVWFVPTVNGFTLYNIGSTGKAFSWVMLRHQNP